MVKNKEARRMKDGIHGNREQVEELSASELRDILSKKNNNNAYEIDMQMIDKISEELNREWS